MTQDRVATKIARLNNANFLIVKIAFCGRHFFRYKNRVSYFDLDDNGRIWFVDAYQGDRIYTHYLGRWRGFTEGGTLRDLVIALRNYIAKGTKIPAGYLGPWPDWYCGGDIWGYNADMEAVRNKAIELEMYDDPKTPANV